MKQVAVETREASGLKFEVEVNSCYNGCTIFSPNQGLPFGVGFRPTGHSATGSDWAVKPLTISRFPRHVHLHGGYARSGVR